MPDASAFLSGIDPELLEKYGRPGPRYTSYPSANHFKPDFPMDQACREWEKPHTAGTALYVHIPFCQQRCAYCGCTTETGHSQLQASAYVEAALREASWVQARLGPGRTWEQLSLGGGTPTFLPPDAMVRLVKALDRIFPPAADQERSVEIHPGTIEISDLDFLLSLDFNRFSLGVQDLDPGVQAIIRRRVDARQVKKLLDHLQQRGVVNSNLDLIYGLPGQTPDTWNRTLEQVIAWQPSRLALFGYAHLPEHFRHQNVLPLDRMPGTRERAALFRQAAARLTGAGYSQVGLDHFCRQDDALLAARMQHSLVRNFMGYTPKPGAEVVGLGASAISLVGRAYTQNRKGVDAYLALAQGPAWDRGWLRSEEEIIRWEIIQELLCYFYLDIAALEQGHAFSFRTHFAYEIDRLRAMECDRLLELEPTGLRVTDLGQIFIRSLCMVFDPFLASDRTRHASAV